MNRVNRHIFGLIFTMALFVTNSSLLMAQYTDSSNQTLGFQSFYDDEYIPDATYEEIEDRLSCIDTEIPLHFNETVKSFINYFTVRNRPYTRQVMQRSKFYFPIFEEYLKKHELPDELKYLAIVESGLQQRARSRAAAVGLWQFISSTGRFYGLHQDWYIDERMDPYEATDAACLHLKSLYRMFGDWELALAAYNCGAGNVRKAMRRSGYKETFWEIYDYLPRETRSYVPQFTAITYAFSYAEEHGFVLDQEEYMFPFQVDTLHVDGYLDLKSFAEQIGVCFEEIDLINPSVRHGAIPEGTKNFPLRVPSEKMEFLLANQSQILDSASKSNKEQLEYIARNTVGSTWGREKVIHRVQSGDVLGKIAEAYHVNVSDIRKWNNINGNLIRVGQRLDIWVKPAYASQTTSEPKQTTQAKPVVIAGNKYHVVQPGDTLWDIAKAYDGLSIEKLKQLNNLKNNNIKPGQKLVIG